MSTRRTIPVRTPRRGSAYFAVLGAAMVVSIIGMGALSIVRSQRLTVVQQFDAVRARLLAESGVEWVAQLIATDSAWRSGRSSGPWHSGKIESADLTIEGTDTDGDLNNRPTDPVTLKATVVSGTATQIVQVTLTAGGPPMDLLRYGVFTGGEFRVRSGSVTNTGAPVGTNGSLRNEATITGDVECVALISAGTIGGTLTTPITPKGLPPSSIVSMYTNLGTVISPGPILQNAVLTPGYNPFGTANPDGVYVWDSVGDLLLRNVRIEGTLVVLCAAGRKLTVDKAVFIRNARGDYPALIVNGDLELKCDSATTTLNESDANMSFNPTGAAYPYPGGVADTDLTDTYPNEIRGLVHCRGAVTFGNTILVRGAVIADSTSGETVRVEGSPQIIYDATLWTNPPMGYMKGVTMSVQEGSWKQVVLP